MTEKYDVVVIGSGPGGYVAAIRCAQLGLKTACIEKGELGGTCLNVGCIPSKALLHSSEMVYQIAHHMADHGINVEHATFEFDEMMERKEKVVSSFNHGVASLLRKNKVIQYQGTASLLSATRVKIEGEKTQEVEAAHIILATGSEPISLPFLPIDEQRVVTSTGALSLSDIPRRLLVIGAGVIGVELGSVYSRLGAEVTFIEFLPHICPTLDRTLSKSFQTILEKQGLTFHLGSKVTGAEITPEEIVLSVAKGEETLTFHGDVVLCAIGRRPYTQGLGLQNVGIELDPKGFIPINNRFQTKVPSIYAIGDVVDGPMLAHKASEEAVAVAEIIAGENPCISYMAIPTVIYTDPEVACVGLTEEEARALGLTIKVGTFPLSINSRAKCTGQEEGMVKIISHAKTDTLLGIHMIGAHASEIIGEGALAVQKKMTTLDLATTPHAHPTLSEAVKEAALAVHGRAIHR